MEEVRGDFELDDENAASASASASALVLEPRPTTTKGLTNSSTDHGQNEEEHVQPSGENMLFGSTPGPKLPGRGVELG